MACQLSEFSEVKETNQNHHRNIKKVEEAHMKTVSGEYTARAERT